MHDVVGYLKEVVQRGPASGVAGCYVIKDGSIYARNMSMQAGIEWAAGADFTVHADAVDVALSRMKEVQELRIEENNIVLKFGRLRSTIKRLFDEPPPLPDMPEEWLDGTAGLTAAMDVARKFMGEQRWTAGLRLWEDRVTASDGNALIDIKVPNLYLEKPYLLTKDVVAFLVAQGDPDEVGPQENAICFRWSDGRWMRAQLLTDEMPEETFVRLFGERLGEDAPVPITDEWKEALDDAAALGDGVVRLTIEGLQTMKENVSTDINVEVDVPTDHSSFWNVKSLQSMSAVAKSWNPLAYPNPALFLGGGLRGAVVGMNKR